jgi:hypothetical protein
MDRFESFVPHQLFVLRHIFDTIFSTQEQVAALVHSSWLLTNAVLIGPQADMPTQWFFTSNVKVNIQTTGW